MIGDRIVIVDDDEDDLFFLQEAFQKVGITEGITLYTSPKEFLETLFSIEELPLLTVLDYNMPLLTGEAVLMEMRKHPQFSTTKVIILSTGMQAELGKWLLGLGAFCCINKPYKPEGYLVLADQFKQLINDHEEGKPMNLQIFSR